MILVTPKQEVERKSECFYGVIFFHSFFKQSEKPVFEQKFAFSAVVFFHMRLFFVVFLLLIRCFSLVFSHPCLVYARSRFLFCQWIFFESFQELSCYVFLQFKKFALYWGAVFFLRSVHKFSWFLKSNWSSDFGHAETGSGAKWSEIFSL